MSELNNCDMKDWTRELSLPNYYLESVNGGVPIDETLVFGGVRGGTGTALAKMWISLLDHLGEEKTNEIFSKSKMLQSNRIVVDDFSALYKINPTNHLTHSGNTPRIEPRNKPSLLIMRLIERI